MKRGKQQDGRLSNQSSLPGAGGEDDDATRAAVARLRGGRCLVGTANDGCSINRQARSQILKERTYLCLFLCLMD